MEIIISRRLATNYFVGPRMAILGLRSGRFINLILVSIDVYQIYLIQYYLEPYVKLLITDFILYLIRFFIYFLLDSEIWRLESI